jgi:hypothetical protein
VLNPTLLRHAPKLRHLPKLAQAGRAGSPKRAAIVVGKVVAADVALGFAWTNVIWPLLPVAAIALFCILPLGVLLAATGALEILAGGRGFGLFLLQLGAEIWVLAVLFLALFGSFIAGGIWLLRRLG